MSLHSFIVTHQVFVHPIRHPLELFPNFIEIFFIPLLVILILVEGKFQKKTFSHIGLELGITLCMYHSISVIRTTSR